MQRSSFLSFFPGYGLLLPLGLCGMFLAVRDYRRLFPLYLFLFTNVIAVVLTLVTWRYRMPLTLALFPFAGFFIINMVAWIRNRRFSLLITGIVLLVLFVFISQEPSVRKYNLDRDMKKAEARMEMAGRIKSLLDEIASKSAASDEERSRLLAELAEVRFRQSDYESAIEIARQSLSLNPSQPRLWQRLAYMLNHLGNEEKAKEAREKAEMYTVK
ncbi:MAG: tetratricopeptide repeat protein [Candidatus Methanoperedens sp.]|nr:tetratricopeptide repeat protein [Candidatus Methanoperedens sp.]